MEINLINKIRKNKFRTQNGFTIIEVIIACAIITITVFSLMSASTKGMELSGQALRQTQANFLLEEGAEAVKIIRDNNWETINALNLETNYYLFYNINSNIWTLSLSEETPANAVPNYPIDGVFSRKVVFSSVNRSGSGDIDDVGTLDEGTKKVIVTVSWPYLGSTISKELVFYIADIFN